MKFSIEKNEKYVLFKLHEAKLNSLISSELKAEFVLLNQQLNNNIIVDLSETQYCDSSGLSAILVGFRLSRNSNGAFVLTGLQDHVRKLISISQLDNMLVITPTVSEAVDYIFMDEVEKHLHKE
ncbi:MAG: STAS domain-containing protein [Bacteroidetes bacterium]|nr:STAS domain-containing protein [Bacteroidota bacterium]